MTPNGNAVNGATACYARESGRECSMPPLWKSQLRYARKHVRTWPCWIRVRLVERVSTTDTESLGAGRGNLGSHQASCLRCLARRRCRVEWFVAGRRLLGANLRLEILALLRRPLLHSCGGHPQALRD